MATYGDQCYDMAADAYHISCMVWRRRRRRARPLERDREIERVSLFWREGFRGGGYSRLSSVSVMAKMAGRKTTAGGKGRGAIGHKFASAIGHKLRLWREALF